MTIADLAYQHALDRLSKIGFDALSGQERDIATLWHVEARVNNSGFIRYYSSHGGDLAFNAPEALTRIGALEKASIVRSVNALFGPSGPSRDRKERVAVIKTLSAESIAAIDDMEQRFCQDSEDIDALVERYASKVNRLTSA
jgi:hypothetical protein